MPEYEKTPNLSLTLSLLAWKSMLEFLESDCNTFALGAHCLATRVGGAS